jgi:hypothetical protein
MQAAAAERAQLAREQAEAAEPAPATVVQTDTD